MPDPNPLLVRLPHLSAPTLGIPAPNPAKLLEAINPAGEGEVGVVLTAWHTRWDGHVSNYGLLKYKKPWMIF